MRAPAVRLQQCVWTPCLNPDGHALPALETSPQGPSPARGASGTISPKARKVRKVGRRSAPLSCVHERIRGLLAVLSAGAVIYPIEVSKQNFMRDYGAMSAITLLLALFIFWPRKQRQLSKVEGAILLSGYAAYLGYLYQQTVTA